MENGGSIGLKLGCCTLRTPVDKCIAIGQDLGTALGLCQKSVRWLEGLNDFCGPLGCVDDDNFALGERIRTELRSPATLRSMCCIVKERNHLLMLVLFDETSMMLEAERDITTQFKV